MNNQNIQTEAGNTGLKFSFSDLSLNDGLMESIVRMGYKTPTEIQSKSIPALLDGRDVVGQSRTGSGKTASYLLPILNNVIAGNGFSLILVPTKELALQVEESARKLSPHLFQLRIAVIMGGAPMGKQIAKLQQSPQLIIATPGRLMDHMNRRTVNFDKLRTLVLDEADRMLDMGFLPQIRRILPKLPTKKQTALFSATFPPEIKNLISELTRDAVQVSAGTKNEAPVTIDQQVIETVVQKKNDILLDELNSRQGSILIFCKTKHKTDKLAKYLTEYGFEVGRIHGNRSLAQRTNAINEFKSGKIRILCATDIAGRGLDIPQVGHVINFDLTQIPEDYLHRIGRTGRAGASGKALSFVTPEERRMWMSIQRLMGSKMQATITKLEGNASPQAKPAQTPQAPKQQGDQRRPQQNSRPQRDGQRPQRSGGGRPQFNGQRRDDRRPQRDGQRPQRSDGGRPQFRTPTARRDEYRPERRDESRGDERRSDERRDDRRDEQRTVSGRPGGKPSHRTDAKPFKKNFGSSPRPKGFNKDRGSQRQDRAPSY